MGQEGRERIPVKSEWCHGKEGETKACSGENIAETLVERQN